MFTVNELELFLGQSLVLNYKISCLHYISLTQVFDNHIDKHMQYIIGMFYSL